MDFELGPEEQLLKESIADFAQSSFGPLRGARSADVDWRTPWNAMTKMGLTGLLVPTQYGGSGGTLIDACIVAEELAKADAWLPFVGSSVVSVLGLQTDAAANRDALARAAEGEVFSTLVDERMEWSAGTFSLAFDWRPDATILCLERDAVVAAERQAPISVDITDFAHPLARFPSVEVGPVNWAPELRIMRAAGWVVLAAWLNGLAMVALGDAVAHAKTRQQFDAPIGSFQAIQHMCADMLVDIETSRSATYAAAWTIANGPLDEAEIAAAAAKAWCATTSVRVCEGSIQIFGGIGITWEHAAHLRLRTSDQFRQALGAPDTLCRFVAAGRGLSTVGANGPARHTQAG